MRFNHCLDSLDNAWTGDWALLFLYYKYFAVLPTLHTRNFLVCKVGGHNARLAVVAKTNLSTLCNSSLLEVVYDI